MLLDEDDNLDNLHDICVELTSFNDCFNFYNSSGSIALSVFHTNIRSISRNLDELLIYLNSLLPRLDIVVLSECWLGGGEEAIHIEGFDLVLTERQRNQNDGLVILINKHLSVTATQITLGDVYGISLDFTYLNGQFNLLAVYRTFDSCIDSFVSELEDYYERIGLNKMCIFLGDINICILKDVNSSNKYLNSLLGAGLQQCIDKPTRVTNHSESCLDHIFVRYNDMSRVKSAVIQTGITDHYSTGLAITAPDLAPGHDTGHIPRTYTDRTQLTHNLMHADWSPVINCVDIERCSEQFNEIVCRCMANSKKTIKQNNTRSKKLKPWITLELIRSIRIRDKLSKIVKKQPFNNQILQLYRQYRQNLSKYIKVEKRNYYRSKLNESNNNPKLFWGIINELSGKIKNRDSFSLRKFIESNSPVSFDVYNRVAAEFNMFFSSVGQNLAEGIDSGGDLVVNDDDYKLNSEFTLHTVTELDITRQITALKGGSAPGIDDVSSDILKQNIKIFLLPLHHLINLSIKTGNFPTPFKVAKVFPLFKGGGHSDKNNYRPISLLSVFSKVLERIVKEQLVSYMQINNIFSERQYGFRKDKNINEALFDINKEINESISDGQRAMLIFLDLKKAFDSINRTKLLTKLQNIGVGGSALVWFQSYLSKRLQCVSIDGIKSDPLSVDYGVIQGSTLGPILFLIYINNISKTRINGKLFLFADDTLIFIKGKTWQDVRNKAQHDLAILKKWFDQNTLSLNVTKTKFMPISLTKFNDYNLQDLIIHNCGNLFEPLCNCEKIEKVNNYKYLGVVFDTRMSWECHVQLLIKKLRRYFFAFKQLGEVLDDKEIRLAYYAYIQSILSFGNLAWGGARISIIQPLFIAQKKILKIAYKKPLRYSTISLFKESSCFSVRQLYIKSLLIHIILNYRSLYTGIQHFHNTRYSQNIGTTTLQLKKHFSFTNSYYLGNLLYRNIRQHFNYTEIFNSPSLSILKKRVNEWIMKLGLEGAEDIILAGFRPNS